MFNQKIEDKMKNLTKIFMAFVAVMLASCVTDTTVDSAIELGKVKTTIDLSLEGTKTHLGDKVDKHYPLLWSAGDQIAVNGIVSEPLAAEFDGKANASFEFELEPGQELAYPRSIVYPAPAEGESGVTFPATQVYKAGNIADGMAPLYGYAAEGEVPTLKHLTGVLKFAVKGDVTLSSVTVKSESGAIAGSYDINFETGKLTAQEGKTSEQISMSFGGEGLVLNAEEATPIYITVPAGEYGAVRITLTTTEAKKMTIKFDTGAAKAIAAGTVREFPAFPFTENDLDGDIFEIWDIEDLKMFAKTAESFPWKEAKLMATINMKGVEWTPIEHFTKVFDGGNENATQEGDEGICIKGLSAPLFGTVAADIKNLKLVDVAIVETERIISGAIACQLAEGGSLTNCEATGTFEVNNTTYKATGEAHGVRSIGCMVGVATNAPITDCVNRVSLTITSMAAAIANNTYYDFGGIVGAMINTAGCDLKNCKNYGEIIYNHDGKGQRAKPSVGGIAGIAKSAKIENLYNYADVSLNGTTYQATPGGVVGYLVLPEEVNNIVNEGDITLAKDSYPNIGGVFGQADGLSNIEGLVFTGLVNSGNVTMKYVVEQVMIGGLIGHIIQTEGGLPHQISIDNSNNSGAISVVNAQADATVQAGGLVGRARIYTFTNCENTAEGSVTVSGTAGTVTAGGLVAWNYSAHDAANPQGIMESCVNKGSVEVSATVTDAYIAGVLANKNSGYCLGCNEGAVTFSGTSTGGVRIAGNTAVISRRINGISAERQAINKGTITFSGSAATAYVAGCIGYCLRDTQGYSLNDSTGSIVVSESASAETIYVGGVVAMMDIYVDQKTQVETKADVNANTNTGNITFNGDATTAYIGGIAGYMCDAGKSNTNSGTITIGETATIATLNIGGLVGYAGGNVTSSTSEGAVSFNGDATSASIGGAVGYLASTAGTLTNSGTITIGETASFAAALELGGIVGYAGGNLETLTNNGSITYNGDASTAATKFRIGGVVGTAAAGTHKTLKNSDTAVLNIGGTIGIGSGWGYHAVGGVAGYLQKTPTQLENHAEVNVSATVKEISKSTCFNVGGVIGYGGTASVTKAYNYGALNISGTSEAACAYYVSGVVGRLKGAANTLYNSGKITVSNMTTEEVLSVTGCCGMEVCANFKPTNARNDGEIVVESSVTAGSELLVGGVSASETVGSSATFAPVGMVNTGNITVGANATSLYVGGVSTRMGMANVKLDMINTGNITVTKPEGVKYTNDKAFIGGVVANLQNTGNSAKVYCDIQAVDFTNIGMITGSARSATVVATTCEVGGRIATTVTKENGVIGVDPGTNQPIYGTIDVPVWKTLVDKTATLGEDEVYFYDHIYGAAVAWTEDLNYDGCSWLSEKPTVE